MKRLNYKTLIFRLFPFPFLFIIVAFSLLDDAGRTIDQRRPGHSDPGDLTRVVPSSVMFTELVSRGWALQIHEYDEQSRKVEATRQRMVDVMTDLGIVDIPSWNLEERKPFLEPGEYEKYTQFFEAKLAYEEENMILTNMRTGTEPVGVTLENQRF